MRGREINRTRKPGKPLAIVMEWGIVAASLCILLTFLRPISSVSVALADTLARSPGTSRVLATGLVLTGFTLCYWILRRSRRLTVRLGLKVYVLAAMGMAGVYYLVYVSHANCYSFGANVAPAPSVLDFVYFSFVTVTTLGYGDIVPNHTFVRMLVVLQILFGVMLIMRAAPNRTGSHGMRLHENDTAPDARHRDSANWRSDEDT